VRYKLRKIRRFANSENRSAKARLIDDLGNARLIKTPRPDSYDVNPGPLRA
jgi:hypothetical protein